MFAEVPLPIQSSEDELDADKIPPSGHSEEHP